MNTPARLAAIRAALQTHAAQAVLVPSSDPHLSEYLPERWQARQWASGFDGSAGTLVVTATHAALFTDSRYWSQADSQLQGSGIALEKINNDNTPLYAWLAQQLPPGSTLLVDGLVLGLASERALRQALTKAGIALRTGVDLFDASVWPQRPALPSAPVHEHLPPFATQPRADKLAQVRAALAEHGCQWHLLSALDDIAWLLNLRGRDVPYNPVFLAHLLLGVASATLFVADAKIDAALAARLQTDGVAIQPYGAVAAALAAIPADQRVLLDARRVTYGLRHSLHPDVAVVEAINPSTLRKSRKTAAEIDCIRQTMREDGAAMCVFYAWLEQALPTQTVTELDVAQHLSAARAQRPGFMDLSFPVIAGFNANGALPHYQATPTAYATLAGDGLLLLDSGGQYLGGTTDITRTWGLGQVSAAHRRDYTTVLKGLLALSRTTFPEGTLGSALDAIARAPLWAQGLDYGHGTGHGVGYYLNVHEGPHSISKVSKTTATPHHALHAGMVTSIEPAVYRPGHWGVRLENLVLTVPIDTTEQGAFGQMLGFETLSLCPFDARCIEHSLLDDHEVAWLNQYQAQVRATLRPLLDGPALDWLLRHTEPIDVQNSRVKAGYQT